MKKYAIGVLVLYIILLLIPLPVLNLSGQQSKKNNSGDQLGEEISGGASGESSSGKSGESDKADDSGGADETRKTGFFKMLLREEDKVIEISERDFLIGTVATEMSPTFHSEALKAQAAAAYNYYSVQRIKQAENPSDDLKGADFADSSSGVLIFRNFDNLRERWGDNFDAYYMKISESVDAVIGKRITFGGEIITAVYHSINSGKTEDAATVWGADYSYLKPVDSSGDKLSPDYEKMVSFTAEELKEKLGVLEEVNLGGEASGWILGELKKTESGTVTEITVGGKTFTGRKIREAVGLRSACFDVKFSEGKFVFTTYGYGHGVGMSQYGADYLARQGLGWEEIIKTYYTGVTIE